MNPYTLNIIFYLLIIIIPVIAQINISASYNKHKKITNDANLEGFEVARKILDANGLSNIYVVETNGELTDHYDPTRKVIKLSKDIFHGNTISAMAVAAHECGHALQDKDNYTFMRIRSFLVPIVNFTSNLAWIVIIIGLFASYFNLFLLGIGLISMGLLFQLITLPVEFDASRRAQKELENLKLNNSSEASGIRKVLTAAALTYVASVLTSILEIVRLFLMFNRHDR